MTITDPNPSHLGSSHALFTSTTEVIRRERTLLKTYQQQYYIGLMMNQVQNVQAVASKSNDSLYASLQRPAHVCTQQQEARRPAWSNVSVKQRRREHIRAALTLDAPQQHQGLAQLAPQLHALGGACSFTILKPIPFICGGSLIQRCRLMQR